MNSTRRRVLVTSLNLTALFLVGFADCAFAQCPGGNCPAGAPGQSTGVTGSFGGGDFSECGENAARDLEEERLNAHKYAMQTQTDEQVIQTMQRFFGDELLMEAGEKLDINLSPLLLDIKVSQKAREAIAEKRQAESSFLTGSVYNLLTQDRNFKTCCVRSYETNMSRAEIVNLHPEGDGWSGLWEYYYPTTITEWSNQSSETMIVPQPLFLQELAKAKELLKGPEAVQAVARSISQLKKLADKDITGDTSTEAADQVEEFIHEIDDKVKEEHRFTEGISMVGGVTVRPFIPGMAMSTRRGIAEFFCMHPEQFLKIGSQSDPYQRPAPGGWDEEYGYTLSTPPFSSIFFNGLNLLLDHTQLATLIPRRAEYGSIGGAAMTDIPAGYREWQQNVLARHAALAQPLGKDWTFAPYEPNGGLRGVLEKMNAQPISQGAVASTYIEKNNTWMVLDLMRYKSAQLDRRQFNGMPLSFRVAAGLYDSRINGEDVSTKEGMQSYYKNFEPQPYYRFTGEIPVGGVMNELGYPCMRAFTHQKSENPGPRPDRIILSNKTHNWVTGPQDFVEFDMRSQTRKGGVGLGEELTDQKDGDTPNKCRRDEYRHNYAANLTIFRSCPAGYGIWQHQDRNFELGNFNEVCPGEKLW